MVLRARVAVSARDRVEMDFIFFDGGGRRGGEVKK